MELIYDSFERWLGQMLGRRLKVGKPIINGEEPIDADTLDGRTIRSVMHRIREASKQHRVPDEATMRSRMTHYTTVREELEGKHPAEILGHALVRCYSHEYSSGGPRTFLQALSRKAGLLYPHFQGRAKFKRLRPSTAIIDLLVRACVEFEETVQLDEFLERLWKRFGIMVGGRSNAEWDDGEHLMRFGVPVDGEVLSENTLVFVDQLESMGFAKRYADDVTFVGGSNVG
jgi:hypothetical protein